MSGESRGTWAWTLGDVSEASRARQNVATAMAMARVPSWRVSSKRKFSERREIVKMTKILDTPKKIIKFENSKNM